MSKCVLCGSEFDIECEECDYMALNDYATSMERELYELHQKIQNGEIPSNLVKYRMPETS